MAKRSKGSRSGTRSKFRKNIRERGLSQISKTLQQFDSDEIVNIIIDSSIHKGQPHNRYHGLTGRIVGTQGRAYLVQVRTGHKSRTLIVRAEHLHKTTT